MLLLARARPWLKVLAVAASASALTHPMAWHIASVLSPAEYRMGVPTIEIGVLLAEAFWYRLWLSTGIFQSLGWSLLSNAASFGIGAWLWQL